MSDPHFQEIPVAERRAVLASLYPLAGDRYAALIRASLILMVATGVSLFGPYLLGRIVDVASAGLPNPIPGLLVAFVTTVIGAAALTWYGRVKVAHEGELILERLRNQLLGHSLRITLDRLERAGTGDLISRLTADINTLSSVIRRALPECALAVLEVTFLGIALLLISPWFVLTILVGAVPVYLGGRWYLRYGPPRYAEQRRRLGRLTERLQEQITGWSTLTSLEQLPNAYQKITESADAIYDADMATTRARNILRPAVIFGQSLSMLATLALGYWLHQQQLMSLGLITAAALYQLRLIDPISTLLELLDNLQAASAAYQRVVGVAELARPANTQSQTPNQPTLNIENLNFRFDESGDWILKNISLSVSPGEHLAIVGPSGAGKTTLGKLLAGIHQPDSGTLTIGGLDYSSIGADLQKHIALLTQESHLFSGALADDLRLANPKASDEQLQKALEQTGAWSWVRQLPNGLQENIGAGYTALSPTQEQQIALARILLLDPQIIILDEAMANMSPESAGAMEQRLDAVLKDRTVIVITHRLDSARLSDRVAVIIDGELAQVGAPADILDP